MRSLKTFQGFLCLLYQFLLILEVKCGTKRELFDCGTVHICDCGLWDEYLKCWNLAPPQVKEIFQAVFTEFFPGEYDLYQDMNPLKIRFCNKTTIENVYEFYVKMDSDLRTYVVKLVPPYGSYTWRLEDRSPGRTLYPKNHWWLGPGCRSGFLPIRNSKSLEGVQAKRFKGREEKVIGNRRGAILLEGFEAVGSVIRKISERSKRW
ncbi:hypothetical protein TNCT_265821 [Trichonephila clavata]|uniref:Uncharacterized protein n=1 Tax=Trichonephila clavata TaxID=2740835 RepID=A0A8X6I4A9_TRICU|nr:hypothetical protein TNCT_265821 [Trichonephila clavata]